jgi:hypothetical protein
MDGESNSYNVVHGRMVLDGTPDFLARRSGVAARLTKPTCRHCGGEDFTHYGRCEGFKRSLSATSPRWWFYRQVEKAAFELGQRRLMQALKEALA